MITEFTVYNGAGTILRTGSALESQAQEQADASKGESVVFTRSDINNDTTGVSDDVGDPVGTIVVKPKTTNSITINKTSFSANGLDEIIINGVGSGALVDIRMPPAADIPDILDSRVDDGVAIITTVEPGSYLVNIDDGVTKPYEVTINAI
jgi:hypothetical protein